MTSNTETRAADRQLVAHYLGEAHAMEAALVTTLMAHLSITPPGDYHDLLQRHLDETRAHAAAIEGRISEIGGGPGLIGTAVGLAETVVGQVLTLAKGPIDLLRGTSHEEKLLKNAKDESSTEALEIATYDALEAVARAADDDDTAELAANHREDEERMLEALRDLIPSLATATLGRREQQADTVRAAAGGQPSRSSRPAPAAGRPPASPNGNGNAPLPNYDLLNAGQVIKRLRDLSPSELDAVADYERTHRNRSTVMAKIEERRRA